MTTDELKTETVCKKLNAIIEEIDFNKVVSENGFADSGPTNFMDQVYGIGYDFEEDFDEDDDEIPLEEGFDLANFEDTNISFSLDISFGFEYLDDKWVNVMKGTFKANSPEDEFNLEELEIPEGVCDNIKDHFVGRLPQVGADSDSNVYDVLFDLLREKQKDVEFLVLLNQYCELNEFNQIETIDDLFGHDSFYNDDYGWFHLYGNFTVE